MFPSRRELTVHKLGNAEAPQREEGTCGARALGDS